MLARLVRFAVLSVLPLLAVPPVSAQTTTVVAPGTAAKTDYSKEGVVYEKIASNWSYQGDGTGTHEITVVAHVQSESAVHEAGLLTFPYASGNEHLEIVYVRVRKPDGSVIVTPAADAQDQPSEVTRQAPFYSDLRETQIPVKSLSAGDRIEYQIREVLTKPLAPNQFWGASNFLTGNVVLEETAELSFPKEKYALVISPKSKPDVTEENGRKIYRWKTSQLEPVGTGDAKKPPVTESNPLPSISWTTYRSWEEVGNWYGSLAKDRSEATAEIQSKAKELTQGKTTDDEKIQAIYNYVSTQVRYIGVAFGIGRYQPHSAEAVLDNQYGDCKDKHTLLAALLKAAGYDAWPVLIGSNFKLHAEIPSPGQFDHVITLVSLPGRVIWLDSTPEITPYQMLMAPLRDKEALVIPTNAAPKLMRTPGDGPFPFVEVFNGAGKLDSEGTLQGRMEFKMRGDNEVNFRAVFHAVNRSQWQTAAQNISNNMGFGGTVSNLDVSLPEKTEAPFTYSYDYNRKSYADWPNRKIVPFTMGVSLTELGDDAPIEPIQLGSPREESHTSTIELPSSYTAVLPSPVTYTTAFAVYETTYKNDGSKFYSTRKLKILQREIPINQADEYRKFVKNVEDDENQFIQLVAANGIKIEASASNAEASRLVQSAYNNIVNHDENGAHVDLQSAEKINPHEWGLWYDYALIDIMEHRMDDAAVDFGKEIQNHPENAATYRALAGVQMQQKHLDDAEKTLRGELRILPDDTLSESQLGAVLIQEKKYDDASTLLEAAVKQAPSHKNLSVEAGRADFLAGRKDAGVAILTKALDGESDPEILNDAAYELANASADLNLAEVNALKAITTLEAKTAQITLGNLSRDDLQRINLLVATWDTMGWVEFRMGKLDSAAAYIAPAWKAQQHSEVGDHLAQIYEKQGRLQDAANMYALALAGEGTNPDPNGLSSMHDRLAALEKQGHKPESKTPGEDLGKERSVTLPRFVDKEATADFFLLVSAKGTEDVQFIKGDETLRPFADKLKQQSFPITVPNGSQAKLVRRGILYCSKVIGSCQFTLLTLQNTSLN